MSNKVLNFDRFISERKSEYIEVTAFGKTYNVKKEIPAIVPIMLARAGEDVNNQEIGLSMMKAGDVMFGKDAIDEMCAAGATVSELGQLFRMVFSMVSGQDIDGDDLDDEEYDDESGKVVKEGKSKK